MCGDISVPEERGGFVGIFNLGPMVSTVVLLYYTLAKGCRSLRPASDQQLAERLHRT